jgi:uncharacterized protein
VVAGLAWKAAALAAHDGRSRREGGLPCPAWFRSLGALWAATRSRTQFWRFVKTLVYAAIRRRLRPDLGPGVERRCRLPLQRDEVTLVMLSLAGGASFTPVQIQKALFLASDKASDAFDRHSRYDFQPYDYGPFDSQVYSDVEGLELRALARINQHPGSRWRTYAATPDGIKEGQRLAGQLTADQRALLKRIVDLVRRLSFNDLVSAIYRAYPPMRARSVFRED